MQPSQTKFRRLAILGTSLSLLGLASFAFSGAGSGGLLSTTLKDFDQPGTQPMTILDPIAGSMECAPCHGGFDPDNEPYERWAASMMAQSSRDPIFYAALAIAEQDADFAGALCLRCHTPGAFLAGRHVPTDGSGLDPVLGDLDGVTCNFCHRMVDPVAAAENPTEDAAVLAALTSPPTTEPHTGQYIIDPVDRRRGPFDLGPNFFYHPWLESPFHQESKMCATCHDVSNPAFTRQPDGTYALNAMDQEHPTHDKADEFPIERTFSEWARSVYALADIDGGGFDAEGRFGGNKTNIATCQDCHLEDASGGACQPVLNPELRDDLPRHDLNGANSWVLRAVRHLYDDSDTGLTAQSVEDSIQRNISMLQRSADLHAFERDGELIVRVVNQTGHKLPTGYGEGRRMWVNVKYFDDRDLLIFENGAYQQGIAFLQHATTHVYEITHGLDEAAALATGLPEGKSFHFILNNKVMKDTRIPPRGFMNQAFDDIQSPIVGTHFPDQHYWDDVAFEIPQGTARIEARLFHQTTTKNYIEFLRDENTTNGAGQLAFDMWRLFGKSAPVEMALTTLELAAPVCPEPLPYGLGKLTTLGERPRIGFTGTPSLAAGNFEVTLENGRPNQLAVLFMGTGATAASFADGFIHLSGITRGGAITLDGNGAGSFPITIDPLMVGTEMYYQVFFRDGGSTMNLGLSDGLYVEFCD